MVLRHWRAAPPPAELLIQTRHRAKAAEDAFFWDILHDDVPDSAGSVGCLIALAGITPGGDQPLEMNRDLAEATLRAARHLGIRRVLLSSSSAVYGLPEGSAPVAESAPLRPLNPYGAAKVAMEEEASRWRAAGLEICCLRIGNVAGADQLLINAGKASADQPVVIDRFASGGGPVRSYLGPATLARVLGALAAHPGPLPAALNIAAPEPVGMDELATAAGARWVWRPAPTNAVERITLDPALLMRHFSFAPADSAPTEMVAQWHNLKDNA